MKKYTDALQPTYRITLSEGASVETILNLLKIPVEEQHQLLIFINGNHVGLSDVVKPDDSLVFFPPLEGG